MKIIEGKTNYFYDSKAENNVCKAHVLHILPHQEIEDDRLIVYRWYDRHQRCWLYGVTTISQQELRADYVQNVIHYRKHKKECRKCGQCGYYMAYVTTEGAKDRYGDCASIDMNNECNEGNNHFKDPDELLLQVDESEDACGFFKAKRTKRVKEYIKEHPDDYYQDTYFKPLPVR